MTEQLRGVVSLASNSPQAPTGYGVQSKLLIDKMKQAGLDVAVLSNYGLEGAMATYQSAHGPVPHYPRGYTLYSGDVMAPYHKHHVADRDIKNFVLTLYDAWVYLGNKELDDLDIVSWVPLDHISIPPKVEAWCRKPNVTTIAMSPFGKRQLDARGIESHYIPHAVDTSVYQPTTTIDGVDVRDYYGVPKDKFLVGMVAANKANGQIHRKAYAENLMSFSLFHKQFPDSVLYIHAEPSKVFGGFHLPTLLKAVGLDQDAVVFADPAKLRFGYSDEEMAALYTGMDVLLHPSYGEGFGVPAIEAQACGTRVIASNWAASQDLVAEDGWLVEGQPFWDEAQVAFYNIPLVPSIVNALVEAYKAPREKSIVAQGFASAFDVHSVWKYHWLPFLRKKLA